MTNQVNHITATLINRKILNETYVLLTMKLSQAVPFTAGQYISLKTNGHFRPYSLASLPNNNNDIDLCVDTSPGGPGSQFAAKAPIGTTIDALAPLGHFVIASQSMPTLFIATGAGIAPFKAMVNDLLRGSSNSHPVYLWWGMKHETEIFWKDEWQRIQADYSQFTYQLCLSRETPNENQAYFCGRVTAKLQLQENFNGWQAYICGSTEMVEETKQLLTQKGILREHIHSEQYN